MAYEIESKGLKVEKQVELPLAYRTVRLNVGYRIDLLVEKKIVIEVKVVEKLLPVHRAQVITYLKLSGNQLGFLVNFNAPILKKGIERIVLSNVAKGPELTAKTPSTV